MYSTFPKLNYLPGDKYYPVHPAQTITAIPFVHVDDSKETHLEGLNFDRNRDIYFCNIYQSTVMKVDMQTKNVSTFYKFDERRFKPTAVKPHKDGRLFVCGVDFTSEKIGMCGGIYAIGADGKNQERIVNGYNVDDMVFDSNGGIYFTNYIGTPQQPIGSIEYLSSDFRSLTTVVAHLASPNGVALSTDESLLWVTETNAGRLHRIDIKAPHHSIIANRCEGFLGPDSCSVDEDDNVYVAMARQGRILVFNRNGVLIGQVLMPGRDEGQLLGTSHPMVHPDRKELYITVHDLNGSYGANIYYCGSFAKGHKGAYQYN